MKKILKWTGITLLALIVIIIALPFIFKGKIIAIAKDEMNKNLNAKVDFGNMDFSLLSTFPYFTLSIDNLSVAGVDEFAGDTLISTKKIALSIDLMSVFKGDSYKIREITLSNPRVLAKVLKNGHANWNITKPSAPTPQQPAAPPSKFKMSLKQLDITNGRIVYDDASLGFYIAMVGMNHKLSGDFTQDNFLLKTALDIDKVTMDYGGVRYLNKVKSSVDAEINADMPNFKFTFKDGKLSLNALSFGLEGYWAMPKTDQEMDLKFSAQQAEFKSFLSLVPGAYTKNFADVKTSGKLAFDGYVKGIYNDKTMPAFGVRILVSDARFQYPSLPKSADNIQLDVRVKNETGKPDNTVIDLRKFHVEMAGNPVDMKMHIETPVSDPDIDGNIKGKLDLASIKDVMPLEKDQQLTGKISADLDMKGKVSAIEKQKYDEFNASGELKVEDMSYKSKDSAYNMDIKDMDLKFSPQYVQLADFSATIGKSDIQADGKIENFLQYFFKKDLLKGEFNMKSNTMDLNQFASNSSQAAAKPAAADTASLSVIDVPANIDFVLTSNIDKLLYENLVMDKVSGSITIRDKVVSLDNLKMNVMNGSMNVSGSYNTQDIKKPKVNFNLDIKDFDIPQTVKAFPTVQKLAPVGKYAQGAFSTQLIFNTLLDSKMKPVYNTLNGEGKLQTKSVTISGFEPVDKLADKLKMEKFKKFSFENLNLSYHFENGRVTVDPFDFKLGDTKGTIAGSTGFDQTIDYTWNMQIPRSDFGGAANNALEGLVSAANSKGAKFSLGDNVNLKVKFGGTITKPTIGTDLGEAGKNAMEDLKAKAKEEFDKKKAEMEAKAKAAADSLKTVAENRAKAEADKAKKAAEDKAKAVADSIKKAGEKQLKNKLKGIFK